jgi:hypothetical protein
MKNRFLKFVQLQTWKNVTLTELKINECFEPQISNFKKIFLDNYGNIKKSMKQKLGGFGYKFIVKLYLLDKQLLAKFDSKLPHPIKWHWSSFNFKPS